KISGVGDAKLKRYGDDFIMEIKTYLNENPRIPVPDRESFASPLTMTQKKAKGETFEKTYALIKNRLSIEEIAKTRNLSISTITAHLERLIRDGRDIEIARVVDPVKRAEIEKSFSNLQTWNLNPVVEHLNGTVSYDETKLVRAYLQRKATP
ncbi:MAG: helix-turn-helix domain-containing protein, partial [Thermodesulfobacteriota bacterium]